MTMIMGFGFSGRDQIVHDEIDMTLDVPALFILTPAVKQVQHRIPAFGVGIVYPAECRRRRAAILPVTFE